MWSTKIWIHSVPNKWTSCLIWKRLLSAFAWNYFPLKEAYSDYSNTALSMLWCVDMGAQIFGFSRFRSGNTRCVLIVQMRIADQSEFRHKISFSYSNRLKLSLFLDCVCGQDRLCVMQNWKIAAGTKRTFSRHVLNYRAIFILQSKCS